MDKHAVARGLFREEQHVRDEYEHVQTDLLGSLGVLQGSVSPLRNPGRQCCRPKNARLWQPWQDGLLPVSLSVLRRNSRYRLHLQIVFLSLMCPTPNWPVGGLQRPSHLTRCRLSSLDPATPTLSGTGSNRLRIGLRQTVQDAKIAAPCLLLRRTGDFVATAPVGPSVRVRFSVTQSKVELWIPT